MISILSGILGLIQLFFTIVVGAYFLTMLKTQQNSRSAVEKQSRRELEKLKKLRQIHLTQPLSEKTRPGEFDEIIGQESGLKALSAALCGPNPQHVIIYGPPGVGKTAAARVVLNEAIKSEKSPFREGAKFIETDATTLHFDERSIADPLIGSVHDPIYQGAGAYGPAGIPQPKPGAVTKAHGGILFIDEIGELHPVQMNKLLKVLEDRRVILESAYYSPDDKNIPEHIHDIFKNGLPADFRLVGATTRSPEEIPPALRSRCVEVFFKPLRCEEIALIAKSAAAKGGFLCDDGVCELVSQYAQNGRDAVNIIQTAGSVACLEDRKVITQSDVEWVIEAGRYSPCFEHKLVGLERIGCVSALAVAGISGGTLMEIEVSASRNAALAGSLKVTGIVEQEEFASGAHSLRRTSSIKSSIENVLTVLRSWGKINCADYDIHINFPGSGPVDGPSAGVAIFCAIYSAIKKIPIPDTVSMTGEISITGQIKPVGGVPMKIEAAKRAGAKLIYIPKDNYQQRFGKTLVKPVAHISEIMRDIFTCGEALSAKAIDSR